MIDFSDGTCRMYIQSEPQLLPLLMMLIKWGRISSVVKDSGASTEGLNSFQLSWIMISFCIKEKYLKELQFDFGEFKAEEAEYWLNIARRIKEDESTSTFHAGEILLEFLRYHSKNAISIPDPVDPYVLLECNSTQQNKFLRAFQSVLLSSKLLATKLC